MSSRNPAAPPPPPPQHHSPYGGNAPSWSTLSTTIGTGDESPNEFNGEKPPEYTIRQIDDPENLKNRHRRRPLTERNRCVRCCCCACCLPVWARWLVWFIIIAIIIVIIVLVCLLATFKMPTINFAGIAPASVANSLSPISFSGNSLNVKFNLIVNIQNPNVLPIKLSSVNATAFYPTAAGRTPIGGGFLPYQYVPKQSDFNFTYPFAIKYNPSQDSDQTILDSIADKCGLTGGGKQDLNIDYDIHLTAKVLFVTVHPTISSSASFPCPLDGNTLPGMSANAMGSMLGGSSSDNDSH